MTGLDANLLGGGDSLIPSPAPSPAPTQPLAREDETREFGDAISARRNIYNQVLHAAQNVEPVTNRTHTLRLSGVEYVDPETYSKREQKEAILAGRTLGRRMRGTWELVDNATGNVLDRRRQVIARVPYMTDRGTYVHNGNDQVLRNQQRLRAGVFARRKDNGEIEAHANVLPGKGTSHRYYLDPGKGVFFMRVGQAKLPVIPLLRAMGTTPREFRDAWGDELYAANYKEDDGATLKKLKARFLRHEDVDLEDAQATKEALVRVFENMELDPEVTERTLGTPYKGLSRDAILATTRKLAQIARGEAEVDDRDALPFQQFFGPEDLFAERISRDHARLRRQLLFKATGRGNLQAMPSGALTPQIDAALTGSGLGQALEEVNPAEIFDKLHSISRMGEGGIPSSNAIPEEARQVQPTHMGFMDPLRTPESFKVGVDLYMARNSRKGTNGRIFTHVKDPRTGEMVWRTPQDLADSVVTFPRALERFRKRVPAMRDGKMTWAKKRDVNYVMPDFEGAFSPLGNMVPLKSMVKGQRVSMASRMLTQALPLARAEAPLVQGAVPGTQGRTSFEDEYASRLGAERASQAGRVLDVTDDEIKVRYADGTEGSIELYNNFPFNRKTYIHQTPTVQRGQAFNPGDLLARSNYTDDSGSSALGANLRTAYLSWQGKNFEDAIVISESAAKERLASEHMYQNELNLDDRTKLGRKEYIGLFPSRFDNKTLAKLDDRGIVKPGTVVDKGDPLILATRQRETADNKVHRKGQRGHTDASIVWDHHDSGVVTDVIDGKKGPVVLVKATSEMQVGDKLSGRYGDKGVVAAVVPDDQMPHDRDGRPYEVLLNPLGIVSRTNPSQKVELWLGKLAQHLGQPFKAEDFDDGRDMTEWTRELLQKHGLTDTEDVFDPTRDTKIAGVPTGSRFYMKLHHTAEGKGQARGGGAYTQEDSPAKGGPSGSKRVALLDTNALLSHGATETLRDVGAIRGQRNEDYWVQFMQGYNPQAPRVPMVYEKFVNQLRAAGVNVTRHGSQTNIMALTDKDVDELAGTREIGKGEGVDWNRGMKPITGGLFDKGLTGGHGGKRWAAVKLAEPMPNPVMEEPIRRVLGLTQKQFEGVLDGSHHLPTVGTGPTAIANALDKVDLDKRIAMARAKIKSGSKTERDQAVRELGYLKSAKQLGLHPRDWVLKRAPVLPPAFRPVSMMSNDVPLVSDPNYLYKELIEANDNLRSMQDEVGEDGVGPERLAVYHAFKAVTGLGDPVSQKSQQKGVRGLLKTVFGTSPKFGTVQRKLISTTVDQVGRAVITPNPDFDMDTVGLPEDKAFDVYGKFVARRLRRQGMPLSQALQKIKDRDPMAREYLLEEMDERPVFINRAPVLHRFGIMAFKPKLVRGDTMQVSPLVVKGFNADFDGDAMNFHVPTDPEAVDEAYERMLPSKNLLSPADFQTPVHMPGQEYVGGLYHATSGRSRRPVRQFRTREDVKKALARGEIAMDDRIQILE